MTPDILLDSKTESRVSELAVEINCQYGSLEYSPVHLLAQLIQPEEYYSLLSIADVLVLSPERDANPLLPYDFILSQSMNDSNTGVLLLSEFTAQRQMFQQDVTWINPWDHGNMAEAMHEAMKMSKAERTKRHNVNK